MKLNRETDSPSLRRGRPPKPKPEEKKLAPVRHGIYCDPSKVRIDGRSFFARLKVKIRGHLLEVFKGDPSPLAQTLADGAAANLIIAKSFQAAFLKGEKLPPSILRDYTGLWNSISRDLLTLSQMAKESGAKDPAPSLEEYLKRAATAETVPALIEVKPEKTTGQNEGAPPPANESPAPQPEARASKETAFNWDIFGHDHPQN
jgi:hypothetical protein